MRTWNGGGSRCWTRATGSAPGRRTSDCRGIDMLIGAMNNPKADVLSEIRWMAEMELQFIDLTLEPPAAASWLVDPVRIGAAVQERGLGVVGHTAYYLPIASPFEEIRRAAVAEI